MLCVSPLYKATSVPNQERIISKKCFLSENLYFSTFYGFSPYVGYVVLLTLRFVPSAISESTDSDVN